MSSLLSKGPGWLAGQYSSAGQQEYDEQQRERELDSVDEASTEAPAAPSEAEQEPSLLSMQGLARGASYFPATCLGFSAIAAALLLALGVSMLVFVGVTRCAWRGEGLLPAAVCCTRWLHAALCACNQPARPKSQSSRPRSLQVRRPRGCGVHPPPVL